MTRLLSTVIAAGAAALLVPGAMAATAGGDGVLEGLTDPRAILCLIVFILYYTLVIAEEQTHLRKSKPVMLGAGIIWVVIAYAAPDYGINHEQLRYEALRMGKIHAMNIGQSPESAAMPLS